MKKYIPHILIGLGLLALYLYSKREKPETDHVYVNPGGHFESDFTILDSGNWSGDIGISIYNPINTRNQGEYRDNLYI